MKTIATFGCSYTESTHIGTLNRRLNNWPLFLSKRYNIPVENYARGATSIDFQLCEMLEYKQKNPYSICVFQITRPLRYTIDFKQGYTKDDVESNYIKYQKLSLGRMTSTGIAQEDKKYISELQSKRIFKNYKSWLTAFTTEQIMQNFAASTLLANSIADFCYMHIHPSDENHNNKVSNNYFGKQIKELPVLKDILGETKYNSFRGDAHLGGHHFNKAGNKWIADWVYNKIKDMI